MPSILAASTPHRIAAALLATSFAITFMIAGGASAQPSEPAPSGCGTSYISQAPSSPPLSPVRYDGVLEAGQIAITSIGHSSFVIQSSGGALIATDYGSWRPEGYAPDVVTMDVAHVGHHDFSPPAAIKTVLMSWTPESGPMRHDLSFKDTHIRNVSTDVVVGRNAGDDSLVGGTGDDSITATEGDDTLEGGEGSDTMHGGADNDRLVGGRGAARTA